jgi:hypothetical protein
MLFPWGNTFRVLPSVTGTLFVSPEQYWAFSMVSLKMPWKGPSPSSVWSAKGMVFFSMIMCGSSRKVNMM